MKRLLRWAAALAAVTCVAAPATVCAQTTTEMDLGACVAEATANSHALRAAHYRAEAADARAAGAQASRWPTVGALGTYDYVSEVTTIDIPIGPTPRTIEFGDGNTYRVALGVDVPIFTGGALGATAHADRAGAGAAVYDVAADSLAVVRGVRTAFYRALTSRSQLNTARVVVRRLERHLEQIEKSIDIGAASDEERVQATARLRAAEQGMLAAEMRRVTNELALGTAIGRAGERVAPRGDLDATLLVTAAPSDDAIMLRPELAALAMRRRESDERARAARGALMPSLMASAYMNYGRPGADPIENDWMSWASARVSLGWTLFDAGARRQRVESARASARAIEAARTDLERRFAGAFATAQVRLEFAHRQAEKAAERLAVERRRLELVTGRRDEGMATETELLDAHDDLADAEASEVTARAAVRLAESELLYAAGR